MEIEHYGEFVIDWETIGATSEVVGAIAVVASLIYLAVEIKRQSRENSLQAANELAAQWSGLMISLHEGSGEASNARSVI